MQSGYRQRGRVRTLDLSPLILIPSINNFQILQNIGRVLQIFTVSKSRRMSGCHGTIVRQTKAAWS